MSFGIDGLVSGLQTTALIDSLMQIEAVPQTLLKNKVSSSQTMISALQDLNSKVAQLATLAETTAKPQALDLYRATSSSPDVTVSTAAGSSAGSVDIVVDRLAQAQVGVSAAMTAWPDSPPVLTIVDDAGVATEVTAASTSLDDVVAAVNSAAAGVTVVKIASGTDGSGNPQYRLQFSAVTSGAAGAFSVYRGSSAQVSGGTAIDLMTEPGAATIRTAQDAQVTLWAGTTAAQTITSSTNTFADLLPGTSVTVAAAAASPVTITVARDADQISAMAGSLVSAINTVFAFISVKSSVSTATDAKGVSTTTAGLFVGESIVRQVGQAILTAASAPVDGRSPAEIGISVTKTGTIEFDPAKFAAVLAADPDKAMGTVQQIAARVQVAAASASDPYEGTITGTITGQESMVKQLGEQIGDWDARLAARRTSLERIYAAMEVRLSAMNSQSSWLQSQLASIPTAGSSQS